MSHYLLAIMKTHDAETFAEYQVGTVRTMSAYKMTPVAATGAINVEEGELDANVLVLIRFEGEAEYQRWWTSEEYAKIRPLREKSTDTLLAVTFPGTVALPPDAFTD